MTLPFCTTSCNTNSLTAVGDEQGGVGLLDSASSHKDGFTKHYLAMREVHNNAVMDLAFSEDDALLATASGDQNSHVIVGAENSANDLLSYWTHCLCQASSISGRFLQYFGYMQS